jgi:hypothetical protein
MEQEADIGEARTIPVISGGLRRLGASRNAGLLVWLYNGVE